MGLVSGTNVSMYLGVTLCLHLMTGCNEPPRGKPTATPTEPIRFCAPPEAVEEWRDVYAQRLIFVVVEGGPDYADKVRPSLDVTRRVMASVAEPGDQLALMWLEAENWRDGVVFNDRVDAIPAPVFGVAPTAVKPQQSTVAPLHEPTSQTVFGQVAEQRSAQQTQQVMDVTATVEANAVACAEAAWATEIASEAQAWRSARDRTLVEFDQKLAGRLSELEPGSQQQRDRLYEGLALAADFSGTYCSRTSTQPPCSSVLLLFSDLLDFRMNDWPDGLNLSGIDIYVILWDCPYLGDSVAGCSTEFIEVWSRNLAESGARSVTFLNSTQAESVLVTTLEKR